MIQKVLCECDSYSCPEVIMMETSDFNAGYVHISKSCTVGKKDSDILVDTYETYYVYREA